MLSDNSIIKKEEPDLPSQTPAPVTSLDETLGLFAQHIDDCSGKEPMWQSRCYLAYQGLFCQSGRYTLQDIFGGSDHILFDAHSYALPNLLRQYQCLSCPAGTWNPKVETLREGDSCPDSKRSRRAVKNSSAATRISSMSNASPSSPSAGRCATASIAASNSISPSSITSAVTCCRISSLSASFFSLFMMFLRKQGS